MKYKILKENKPIELIELSKNVVIPSLTSLHDDIRQTILIPKVKSLVYTDGLVDKKEHIDPVSVEEYYFNQKEYVNVDTLKKSNVYLKDYTYAIVFVVGEGFNIENIDVYLKNRRDKNALKKVKKVIEDFSLQYEKLMLYTNFNDEKEYDGISSFETKDERVFTLIK